MPHSSVAIIAGSELAAYHFGVDHVFGPQRHQAFLDGMDRQGLTTKVTWLQPVQCTQADLQRFHNDEFIRQVKQCSKSGIGYLDQGDTPARKGIFEAAATVVGSVIDMIDKLMSGQFQHGFVPIAGLHHAYRDHCNGFCIFNDCAIAIEYLRQQYQLQKILYVDIDAHHGDGVFYNYDSNSHVFVIDFHEDGCFLYPGTGDADETGTGPAQGTMMNFPMPKHATDQMVASLWPRAEKFIRQIKPDFIIFQCGADSMKDDPLTQLDYSPKIYQFITTRLCNLANKFCQGKMLALGGGGYNLENISRAWPIVVKAML